MKSIGYIMAFELRGIKLIDYRNFLSTSPVDNNWCLNIRRTIHNKLYTSKIPHDKN
jgi:hypothetical protein